MAAAPKPKGLTAERQLVEDFAEAAAPLGYKVTRHSVSENHEREESTLSVTFVRSQPGQGVLKLHKEGDDEEKEKSKEK